MPLTPPRQRLILHDKYDVALGGALFALTFRAEGPHGDQGRLHVDQGGAVVEAFLRQTLRITVLRVDLQGAHPRHDEEDRQHQREVDSVSGEGDSPPPFRGRLLFLPRRRPFGASRGGKRLTRYLLGLPGKR